MSHFARFVDGAWCDPKDAPSLAALDTMFHPDWVAQRKAENEWFQAVDDATWNALTYSPPSPAPIQNVLAVAAAQHKALVRAKAAALFKKKQTDDAFALLATIGE